MIYGAKINRKSKDGFNIHTLTEIDGVTKSLQEWVKISGIDRTIIKNRYKKGIRGKELLAPVKKRNEKLKFTLNDEEARLIEENFKLVYAGWHRLKQKYPFLDEMELYDACIDAIIYAARNYDESKGTLATLFFINTETNAYKIMGYWNTKKREGARKNFSTDFLFKNDGDEETYIDKYLGVEDEYGFIDREEANKVMGVIKKVFSGLPQREKTIMYKFVFKGMKKQEIADEIGVSPNTVGKDIEAVHRLIAEAFAHEKPENLGIIHISRDVQSESLENLEYVTQQQIMEHAHKNEITYTKRRYKAVEVFNEEGVKIGEFGSIREAGRELNIDHSMIARCCQGKIKTCKGLKFNYKK